MEEFMGRTLMITGGTGSFGNAVLRRFLDADIDEIRIFSRDEKKQDDMRLKYNNNKIKFMIGDVRDQSSVRSAMEGVDYIFHAAALKQVPSCEFFPYEAVKTNVIGTEHVLSAAIELGVKKIICLSTDKAAYPINAMGISKALMEKVVYAKARTTTKTLIACTRYGNVMCSRGSVIPLFIKQIKNGQPLSITNPNMTRFLMSLEDAVELVLYAYHNASFGDLFIQKAPACTVADLAKAIQELFDPHAKTHQIGTRHGEKLYETLATMEEIAKAKEKNGYFQIPLDSRDLNYGNYYDAGEPLCDKIEAYTSHNTKRLTVKQIKKRLLSLEYVQNELKGWI
jgi:UDP-glucose 4-epimerase